MTPGELVGIGDDPRAGFHCFAGIPEEMVHSEIAVGVPVMNEMQFLFPSEPCKSLKPRSLYVVFFVEKDVRVERRRTRD
jgi:hypothetical protein